MPSAEVYVVPLPLGQTDVAVAAGATLVEVGRGKGPSW